MVERCSAIDGTWGLRAENVEMAKRDRQAADGTRARSPRPSSSPATASSRTPRSRKARGKRPVAPAAGAGARLRDRGGRRHEEADRRRHQGPARVRARARRRSAAEIIEMKKRRRIPLGDDHDDRVREHRHDALPDPGDGARRADAARRADRARDRDLQRADPRAPASSSATLFIEITDDDAAARVAAEAASASSTTSRFELGRRRVEVRGGRRRTRSGSRARTSRRPCTTCKFPFTAEQRRRVRATGPVRLVVDHPEYQRRGRAHRRAARRARSATSRDVTAACRSRSSGSIPSCRCRAQQHADDAGLRPPRARGRRCSQPGGGRALVPTGLAVAIPPGYAGFVLPRSGLALQHGVTCLNTPGPHRRRGTAASSRCCS